MIRIKYVDMLKTTIFGSYKINSNQIKSVMWPQNPPPRDCRETLGSSHPAGESVVMFVRSLWVPVSSTNEK